jgi:hypothetical protein
MAQFRSYLIAVKTSNLPGADTDDDTVKASLVGVFGETRPYRLNDKSQIFRERITADYNPITEEKYNPPVEVLPAIVKHGNKFEKDQWDAFKITTDDVGTLLRVRVEKKGDDGWNLEKVVVIPYDHKGTAPDPSRRRNFLVQRWFDGDDFDLLQKLEIDCEESLQAPEWRQLRKAKTAKTMVMRYENSEKEALSTTFKFHYSIVQGVAIEASQTKDTKTGHTRTHSWEVSAKESGKVGVAEVELEQKYSGSDVCTREISKSCSDKYGTTTTTSMNQEQEIPVTVPENGAVTLIVQVYQTALSHQVKYGDYEIPVTVYDGTVDISFKLYPEVLSEEIALERSRELAKVAGAKLDN